MSDISASPTGSPGEGGPSEPQQAGIDPWVFGVAAGISLAFVLWGMLDNEGVATVADQVLSWVISTFGWLFVLSTAAFLVFAGVLAFSRFGCLRLGKDDDRPEFRTASWIAMTFSAGMGISALQQPGNIAAAPFTLVMIGLCISLFKGLGQDAATAIAPQPGARAARRAPVVRSPAAGGK